MIPTKEALAWLQIQILEQIRASHSATVEAVRAWASVATTATSDGNTRLGLSMTPGLPQLEGSQPLNPGWREDPKDVVDSTFAFARELLDLNRQFAHRLLLVSRPSAAPRLVGPDSESDARKQSGARKRVTTRADTAVTEGPTAEVAKPARGASKRRPRSATKRVAKRASNGATE